MDDERYYYINNSWITYEEAHNQYGYTLSVPEIITLYTQTCDPVNIRKDIDDNTYYDSENKQWVSNLSIFGLYKRIGNIILFMCEQPIVYTGYTDSIIGNTANYVEIEGSLVSIEYLYGHQGITEYQCSVYYVKSGEILSWYDSIKHLYWDINRHSWSAEPPDYGNELVLVGQMPTIDYGETFIHSQMVEIPFNIYTMPLDNSLNEKILCPVSGISLYTMNSMDNLPDVDLTELEIIVGVRWDPNGSQTWLSKTWSANDWWWCGILNESDCVNIRRIGLDIKLANSDSGRWAGPIGEIEYRSSYTYEILAFYSDLGTTEVSFDPSNFYMGEIPSGYSYSNCLIIWSVNSFNTAVKSYKLKISRPV